MLKSFEGKDEHFCCVIGKDTDSMGLLFFNRPPPIIDKLCVQIIPPNSESLYINECERSVCVCVCIVLVCANLYILK